MGDLKDSRLIYAKGFLFLGGAILGSILVLLENPTLKTAALLGATLWCACRFYYFAFYVVEKYVDGKYRFAGLLDFAGYLLRKGRGQEVP